MKNAVLLLSSFFLLLSCSVKESLGTDIPPGNISWGKNIPLAGNAWVLTDPLASSSLIQENGLANWPDPAHSIGIFFHLSKAGEIRIAIRARVISGESVLKYTFGGKTGEISLHNTNWAIIPIGTFVVGLPGYQKLELQGKNHTGPTFAEVEEVLLLWPMVLTKAISAFKSIRIQSGASLFLSRKFHSRNRAHLPVCPLQQPMGLLYPWTMA